MDYKTFIRRAAQEGFRFTVRFDDGEWISPKDETLDDPEEVIDHIKAVEMCVVRISAAWDEMVFKSDTNIDKLNTAWVGSYLVTAWADDPEESIIDYNSNSWWVDNNSLIAEFA